MWLGAQPCRARRLLLRGERADEVAADREGLGRARRRVLPGGAELTWNRVVEHDPLAGDCNHPAYIECSWDPEETDRDGRPHAPRHCSICAYPAPEFL